MNFYGEDLITEEYQISMVSALEGTITNDRDLQVTLKRLGFFDGRSRTLQNIGDEYGITRERVRQLVNRSFKRIVIAYNREIKRQNHLHPCVTFVSQLRQWVMPGETCDVMNIATLVLRLSSFPSAQTVGMIAALCYPNKEVDEIKKSVLRIISSFHKSTKEHLSYQRKQNKMFKVLFDHISWPTTSKQITVADFERVMPQRSVNADGEGEVGIFFSKKNNTEIEYESLLEYSFCIFLEELDYVKRYIHQPFKIPYTLLGTQRNYFPDFYVLFKDGSTVVVEIKPWTRMGLYENIVKLGALQAFCTKYGFGYLIFEKSRSVSDSLAISVDEKKQAAFMERIHMGPLKWREFQQLRQDQNINWTEFISIVFHNDLEWTLAPFRVELAKESFRSIIEHHKLQTTPRMLVSEEMVVPSMNISSSIDSLSISGQDVVAATNNTEVTTIASQAGATWDKEEEELLVKRFNLNRDLTTLAALHGRTKGAILSRLRKLGIDV